MSEILTITGWCPLRLDCLQEIIYILLITPRLDILITVHTVRGCPRQQAKGFSYYSNRETDTEYYISNMAAYLLPTF